MFRKLALAAALTFAALPAQAHFVWLERDGTGPAAAFFGEWDEDVREKSGAGGHLDMIAGPIAFQGDKSKPLAITRGTDRIEIAAAGPGDVRLVEDSLKPREDKRNGGRTKGVFQAKAGRADTTAGMDLELVPLTANGDTFVLLLRGQPLPKAEVKLAAPPKWACELHTDDKGQVTFVLPWAGRYVAEVIHVETIKGGEGDQAYDRIRHVSSLSFVKADGIPWKDQ